LFFTGRFFGKFAVKCILKIPTHLVYVATLPCELLTSAKQAINDKLQGSVATNVKCGRVLNNQINKSLLLSLRVRKSLKSVNIWQSYKQERDCLVHFVRLANALLKDSLVACFADINVSQGSVATYVIRCGGVFNVCKSVKT